MAGRLFGGKYPPSCAYCEHGKTAQDHIMVLCGKKGLVSPYYSCRKYQYSPLRRIPKRNRPVPEYTAEDFKYKD